VHADHAVHVVRERRTFRRVVCMMGLTAAAKGTEVVALAGLSEGCDRLRAWAYACFSAGAVALVLYCCSSRSDWAVVEHSTPLKPRRCTFLLLAAAGLAQLALLLVLVVQASRFAFAPHRLCPRVGVLRGRALARWPGRTATARASSLSPGPRA